MFLSTDGAAAVTALWLSKMLPPQGLTLWIKKAAPYFTIHDDAVHNVFPTHTQNLIFTFSSNWDSLLHWVLIIINNAKPNKFCCD
jgi:hypothetical protein